MKSLLSSRILLRIIPGALLLSAVLPAAVEDRLAQHRNLGKAFYENPTTSNEAVAEFRKALDLAPSSNREKLNYALALLHGGKLDQSIALLREVQKSDPKLPHTWFNLGIQYKKSGETEQAIRQFEQMERLTPGERIVHYQLGTLYKMTGDARKAEAEFEAAAKLDPLLAAAHFQLYNLYRQSGRTDDAKTQLTAFQKLKKQNEGAAVAEDVDWCDYAEIYDPPVPVTKPVTVPNPVYSDRALPGKVDPKTAGLALIDLTGKGLKGSGETDLLVWSQSGITIFRRGVEPVKDSGLEALTGVLHVAPGDFDNDGLMDLCVVTEAGPQLFRNTGGKFSRIDATLPGRRFERAVWIDYDHDYDLDLVLLGDQPALFRNQGTAGFADRTADFPFIAGHPTDAHKLRMRLDSKAFDLAVFYTGHAPVLYRDQLGGRYAVEPFEGAAPDLKHVEADFDSDGKLEAVSIDQNGAVHLRHNDGAAPGHWVRIQLAGIKSLKTGQDAEIEIKAGPVYRKRFYEGVPLLFEGIDAAQVDTVRITWPNGLIQNEIKQATDHAYRYEEAQRLSGSCPMIWTWNGHEYQFITDVLGVAPLGASDGEGTYFPVDHDEYVSIPGKALVPKNGYLDVRVTEELSEVSYIDQVQLIAVDHPSNVEIFTNEKFKGPPYPEFRLFGVGKRIYPKTAMAANGDGNGRDVRSLILAKDGKYPDQFKRTENGVGELHTLELNFEGSAAAGSAVLLLNGWVDWPDGSTFRAASQERRNGFIFPYLQMQDASGAWRTVNQDMGMPAGKPKTIAVDLQFLGASRKLRIVTNLCVYWDEIFLGENTGAPREHHRELSLESAVLQFRGFSEAKIDAARKQPDTYGYATASPASFWNPTGGMYTRYGDVAPLVRAVDDMPVIMGSGDEMRLRFDAKSLPLLPAGWTRDYLLKVDGWAKDRDPNTAFSTSVEPLPFHGMSVYPYPAGEHFPDDEAHQRYRREYNTRPALKLIRPLTANLARN